MKQIRTLLATSVLALPAYAEAPLSAIDWLKSPAPITVAQPLLLPLGEPPVTDGITTPDVTVEPLDGAIPDAVGLLPSTTTGLPQGLWRQSSTDTLVSQLGRLSDQPLPALQALYYTLLLAEADTPSDAGPNARFLISRIDALRKYGAIEAASAMVARAGGASEPLFDQWLDLSLLEGTEDQVCKTLSQNLNLTNDYAKRIFCTARSGDWATAALTYDTARALGLLTEAETDLLAQFLDPEFAEVSPTLAPPSDMTPLVFRLYEANGAPLPTRNLPREYAIADLRGTVGWRAEIEAAERLARTGALPANRLFGLYTERKPAASGGVWDRVAAVQAFDTAVTDGNADRLVQSLPAAWSYMQEQGLEVAFAAYYGVILTTTALPDANDLAAEIVLLSPAYEQAADVAGISAGRRMTFLTGLSQGVPKAEYAQTAVEKAISEGFSTTKPSPDHAGPLEQGRLGQAILSAASQLDNAGPNQTRDITAAIATLRAVGLEDVARRAALQILLLKRHG